MNTPSENLRNNTNTGLFRRLGIATVFIIYLLILVGGVVRTTGSGMGCPDWPKCFGLWVPPTSVDQLPVDYQQIFSVAGREIAEFSAIKTWIEYFNRLLGAFTGFMIFITLIASLKYRKILPGIFWYSFICFILVAIVGWLGAKVVSTHLMPGMITIHMLGAVLVASSMIMAVATSQRVALHISEEEFSQLKSLKKYWVLAIIVAFIQLLLGTQVREEIDQIALAHHDTSRDLWIGELNWKFYVHRSLSLGYAILSFFVYKIGQKFSDSGIRIWSFVNFVITLIAILAGIVLAYWDMPQFMQPIHLLIGTGICGVLVYLGKIIYSPVKNIELTENQL